MILKKIGLVITLIHLMLLSLIFYIVSIFLLSFLFQTSLLKTSFVYLSKQLGYSIEYDNMKVSFNKDFKVCAYNLSVITSEGNFIRAEEFILEIERPFFIKGYSKKTLVLDNYLIFLKTSESDLLRSSSDESKEKSKYFVSEFYRNIDLRLIRGSISIDLLNSNKLILNNTVANLSKDQNFLHGNVKCGSVTSDISGSTLIEDICLNITTNGENYHLEGNIKNISSQFVNKVSTTNFPFRGFFDVDLSLFLNIHGILFSPESVSKFRLIITSEDGEIMKASLLEKLLSIVNLTEIIFGGGSNILNKNIPYQSLSINSILEENKIKVESVVLDCSSFKASGYGDIDTRSNLIDMLVFITPFKTVDRILSKIPVVNYILNNSLISIPLKLEGKPGELKVRPVPVKVLSKKSVDFIERILTMSFRAFDKHINN